MGYTVIQKYTRYILFAVALRDEMYNDEIVLCTKLFKFKTLYFGYKGL